MPTRKKICVLLSRFPYPIDKGDKLRAYHQLQYLSRYADIHLITLSHHKVSESDKQAIAAYCTSIEIYYLHTFNTVWQSILSFFRAQPIQVGYFYSAQIRKQIHQQLHTLKPDLIYCQLTRTALYAIDLPYPKIIDLQDAFSLNYSRIVSHSKGFYRWFYQRESARMAAFESHVIDHFDKATIISQQDKMALKADKEKVTIVSNGIDTDYYSPQPIERNYELLFLGNLSYLPNRKAVEYILHELCPLLSAQFPNIKITIAGADTPSHYLAMQHPHVSFTGWVDDTRSVYSRAHVFIAPLFAGAGLQNKLLEAMSMGLPCVATSVVNASLQATPDREILIADKASDFVQHISRLLNDAALYHSVSLASRSFVEQNYPWEQVNQELLQVVWPYIAPASQQ